MGHSLRRTLAIASIASIVVLAPFIGSALAAGAVDDGPTVRYHLYATDGTLATADGTELYIWGYSLTPEPGTATLPGPVLEANEGDLVEVVLTNLGPSRAGVHHFPHTIHFHGLDTDQANDGVPETGPSARVGESVTYRFRATHAGTYWYHCHVETVEHLTMGMYGAFVVHPRTGPGRAWTDGPAYDRSYTLLLSESDPAWAAAIADDRTPDRSRFDPRYFYINGRSFPDTMDHPDTHVIGRLGETVLVRLVNAGYGWRSMHMHGFHFEIVATDGRPLSQPYLKDTLSIGPGERYDLLVTLDQLGSYPFHSHVILDNTNDGHYPGGIHTMVTVVAAGEPLDAAASHGHGGDARTEAADSHGHARHDSGNDPTADDDAEAPPTIRRPLGGFGGFPASPPATTPPADGGHHQHEGVPEGSFVVTMERDRFVPEFLTVPLGATVTWVNADPRTHTVVADAFESPDVGRGAVWSMTFSDEGTYAYDCVNHRGMSGVITVRRSPRRRRTKRPDA